MQRELIQDFTRRLSQCNRGGMIVIIYDIYFAYADDAKRAYSDNDREGYRTAVRKAQNTLTELIGALDFSYPISRNLYALYVFSRNELARALYEYHPDGILEAEKVLKRLYTAFQAAAKEDTSGPLMSNTQQVYAGITYGKSELNETYGEMDYDRGFLV